VEEPKRQFMILVLDSCYRLRRFNKVPLAIFPVEALMPK